MALVSKMHRIAKTLPSQEERGRVINRIFAIVRGQTGQEADEVRRDMQADLDYLREENTSLTLEVNDARRKVQSHLENSLFIEQRLEDAL
jgi:regulator of replication initiation timing